MLKVLQASTIFVVISISIADGLGVPLGWLCTSIIALAS